MAWTSENNRSSPSCHHRNQYLSPKKRTRRSSNDCCGERGRVYCSLYHRSCLRHRCVSAIVTASITALLLLLPSSTTTTTFSHAFRSSLPRRGSAKDLGTAIPIIAKSSTTSTASTILRPRSVSSRTVNTCCSLFRQRNDFVSRTFSNRGHRGYISQCSSSNNSPNGLGFLVVPSVRRFMATTPGATTTSLSSTNSSFFFEPPSATEEVGFQQGVYTMESLCSYAEKLIEQNSSGRQQQQNHRFCVYLAGGGSMAVSTLAATSGASSFLLEGRTTYDRHSYLNACEMPDRDTKGRKFSYAGEEAAMIASSAALKQALKLTSMDDDLRKMPLVIGIGCTSALVSGEGSSSGTGTVVAKASDGLVLALTIEMTNDGQRSRFEEDLVLSHLVLRSAEQIMVYRENESAGSSESFATDKEYITRAGDIVTERWELPTTTASANDDDDDDDDATDATTILTEDIDAVVEEAAKRVVDRGEDAVVLLPVYEDDSSTSGTKKMSVKVRALSETVLPNRSLVFPGSFNPIHVGHLALANASIKTLEKHEPYVHPRRHNDKPIFFELSLTNADKPSIDPKIVASRVKKFIELALSTNAGDEQSDENNNGGFPQQWGIVLTRAPLFEEKLKILRSKVLNRLEGPGDSPRINFVIGTDTMVRILNPKYYGNSRANMIESLQELKASGAGFVVGGRLEQSPAQATTTNDDGSSSSSPSPRFVSGREELEGLPEEVASAFTIMEESEFRVDLSSSEIRKAQQEKKQKESLTT